jgi:hypothetical protein
MMCKSIIHKEYIEFTDKINKLFSVECGLQ